MALIRVLSWCLPLLLLGALRPAAAATVGNLYEAEQAVETTREAAFVAALRTVVVRVSGQRDAPARLGAALNDPNRYVQSFGTTADGRLQVGFDSRSIDRLLLDAGLGVWGRERPAVLVLLNVIGPQGEQIWVADQPPSAVKDMIEAAARQRGLPLVWPNIPPAAVSEDTALDEAERFRANATLLGRATQGSVQWTLISQDGSARAAGTLEDGIHLAADEFARVFVSAGSSLGNVQLEVAGITDLDAYAATLNYLEGMTQVSAVSLEQVSGDVMRFKLAVRGDLQTLRRAFGLDNRLVLQEAAGDGRLVLRYRP